MTPTTTLPCDVLPVADGVLIVPRVLPLHIPADMLDVSVREWLGAASA